MDEAAQGQTAAPRDQRWLALSRTLFAFNAGDRREAHLAVLGCFDDALFDPALNLEQLAATLRATAPELAGDEELLLSVLGQLTHDWALLEPSRDDSATYSDPGEFRRRTLQWALTPDGQAAVAGLNAAADRLAAVASLQPAALDAIAAALSQVAELAADPASDDAALHVRLAEAESHHRTLVDNLRAFTSDVQRLLGRADASDADLAAAKSAILDYLNRYVIDAEAPARRVAAAIDRLSAVGLEVVAERAVRGSNLAPGVGDVDPTVRALDERRRNLAALVGWFNGAGDRDAQFSQLLPRGRDAILRFMRILELRREQRRRAASLPDDFRALARAFAGAPTRADCHRLWTAAVALHPARHHHLPVDDATPVEAGRAVATNPPVALDVELRRRPRPTGPAGQDRPVADARARRAARQAAQAEELAARLHRRRGLHRPHTARLSTLTGPGGLLDDDVFDDLLDLLAQALSTPAGGDGVRRAASADGQVEVVLQPLDTTATATLRCSRGRLLAPDLRLSIHLSGAPVVLADEEVGA